MTANHEPNGIQQAIAEGKTDDEIVATIMQNTNLDVVDARLMVELERNPEMPWPDAS